MLRTVLKDEPENEAAVEQLTQLLLDQGKLAQAVALLENLNSRTPSATLLDLLGDAYTQTKNLPKAEEAYRKAVDLDSSELSHLRGLGQTLLSEEKFSDALTVYQKLADLMPDDSDIYLRIGQGYPHCMTTTDPVTPESRQFVDRAGSGRAHHCRNWTANWLAPVSPVRCGSGD